MFPPRRIVCLTEETVETLYLLGEQDRIVGISGYVVRPPQARREKPRVSAFTSANIDKILALRPDLVLTFSDLQADIAADLIRRGIDVHAFNQRSVAGILDMIRMVGAMVDASDRAEQLVGTIEARLAEAQHRAECLPKRPRVFFEEWDDPLISGIGWVSELVAIADGIDIFADLASQGAAKDRVVTIDEVVAREPDMIIGSWCRFVARINSRAQSALRSDIYVRRTYSGRPSSSMRFSEAAAMATSVVCRPPVRECSASPITRL
jgi:iron complex transport system substrate-binding protein